MNSNSVTVPIIINSSSKVVKDPEEVKKEVSSQLYNAVFWDQSIQQLAEMNVEQGIVVGPDSNETLKRMIAKTNCNIKIHTVNDLQSLVDAEKFLES